MVPPCVWQVWQVERTQGLGNRAMFVYNFGQLLFSPVKREETRRSTRLPSINTFADLMAATGTYG